LTTQLVDNLIRLVAADGRFARGGQGIPRVFAAIPEMPLTRQKFWLSGPGGGLVRVTPPRATGKGWTVRTARVCGGQKERAPAMPEPYLKSVSCLGLTASTVRAGAAQESPKPTHDLSPVHTAHEEQLTEHIP
jgi:hypothetical protein